MSQENKPASILVMVPCEKHGPTPGRFIGRPHEEQGDFRVAWACYECIRETEQGLVEGGEMEIWFDRPPPVEEYVSTFYDVICNFYGVPKRRTP
jgi:hypothetical protein